MSETRNISLTINGTRYSETVEVRYTLADFLRQQLGLTGTHLGCEHGVCGACTILFDGKSARSCLMLAVQADGHELLTVEGIAPSEEELHPLQEAFRDNHGLQCGFCTPGFLMLAASVLERDPDLSDEDLLDGRSARSCLMLAVQADGHELLTVEGIAPNDKELHPLQEAFRDNHGLQCGFCTPGMLTTLLEFLRDNPNPTEQEVRIAISGNLCRCTGYQGIVNAALDAAKRLQGVRA